MKEETEIRIRNNNGGENRLQLELIEELSEEGYVQQLYDFLQGKYHPENINDGDKPNLTADQAWHVIYCLQEHFGALDDRFEKCRECGTIYDSYEGGTTIDSDSTRTRYDNGKEVKEKFIKSDYGNYCDDCRPD
jgi:hypothetical protein